MDNQRNGSPHYIVYHKPLHSKYPRQRGELPTPPTVTYPPLTPATIPSRPVFTGYAQPGNTVRLCLDRLACTTADVEPNGGFAVQFQTALPAGAQTLRASQMRQDGLESAKTVRKFFVNPNM